MLYLQQDHTTLPLSIPLHLILISLGQNPERNPESIHWIERPDGTSVNGDEEAANIMNSFKSTFINEAMNNIPEFCSRAFGCLCDICI